MPCRNSQKFDVILFILSVNISAQSPSNHDAIVLYRAYRWFDPSYPVLLAYLCYSTFTIFIHGHAVLVFDSCQKNDQEY